MGPRVNLSVLLLFSGAVLLGAIALGNRMGNRVLLQVSQRTEVTPSPMPTPVTELKDPQVSLGWKHVKLVSVATDPAFPDPRVTPFVRSSAAPRRSHKPDRAAAQRGSADLSRSPTSPPLNGREEPLPEPGTPIPYATPQL